jgi:Uma2 family endonuclease
MTTSAIDIGTSVEGFLEWEQQQSARYELVGGVVRQMAGGIEDHDRISGNAFAALHSRLRGSHCSVHGSNLKVVSRPAGAVMYPDVFVRCGPRASHRTSVEDPVLVVEVLSEGTAQHDLTRKRLAYEAIPSLRRIAYVWVDEARIDMRVRDDSGRWGDETAEGLDAAMPVPELDLALPMIEIYEDSAVAGA